MRKTTNNAKKVLVIDDEGSILDTIKIVLELEGYEVVLRQVPPTVGHIIKIDPDIILLDFLLKGTNGKDICIKLKGNDKAKHFPVIMLSACTKPIIEEAVHACGANGFLTKPFDIDVLAAIVRKYAK